MNKIIEVNGLVKKYGSFEAVKNISFYVESGKLFSFLGPNGAGKSTTIDTLCTLNSFNGGTVKINGYDLKKESDAIRKSIGVVFQDNMLDPLLTVRENLQIRAGLYMSGRQNIKKAVYNASMATEVTEFIDRPYGKLSGGQRRRADIARALIHTPKILFLDEPTTGLDPQTRANIWKTIERFKDELGMTVFLTTHYMEEAAESDYIMVMDHGQIVAKGTPTELRQQYASDLLKLAYKDQGAIENILKNSGLEYCHTLDTYVVKIKNTMESMEIIEKSKDYINGFEVVYGTMDDAFMGITGKELRE